MSVLQVLACLALSFTHTNGVYLSEDLAVLAADLLEFFPPSDLALVVDADEDRYPWSPRFESVPVSVLRSDQIDAMSYDFVFVTFSPERTLLHTMCKSMPPKAALVVPWTKDLEMLEGLRLDSQVYSFEAQSAGGYVLWEHFAIKSGPIITQRLGTWNPIGGLNVPSLVIWERRKDLGGVQLRNALLPWRTFNQVEFDAKGNIVSSDGPYTKALNYLARELNFTYALVAPADHKWGMFDGNTSKWSGIMGMAVDGTVDMSTSGLFQTRSRNCVSDVGLFHGFSLLFQHVVELIG